MSVLPGLAIMLAVLGLNPARRRLRAALAPQLRGLYGSKRPERVYHDAETAARAAGRVLGRC